MKRCSMTLAFLLGLFTMLAAPAARAAAPAAGGWGCPPPSLFRGAAVSHEAVYGQAVAPVTLRMRRRAARVLVPGVILADGPAEPAVEDPKSPTDKDVIDCRDVILSAAVWVGQQASDRSAS